MCKVQTPTPAPSSETLSQEKTFEIPAISRTWCKVYLTIPKVDFVWKNISFSFSLVSAAFLILVRVFATKVMQFTLSFSAEDADFAAASVAGVVHSSLLCPGLIAAFWSHSYNPSEHMSKAPHRWWQQSVDALLQFCTGYMIYDAIFIVMMRTDLSLSWVPAFEPDDYLFLMHHMMTATYMTQARIYQAGHMSAMMCMLAGEISNPIMNIWFITAKARTLDCCSGSATFHQVHNYIEIAFCIVYLLCRVVIGPIVCTHMSWNLMFSQSAKEHLPLPIRLLWNMMIWGVILGSYSWIVYCQELLQAQLGSGATNGGVGVEL